MHASLPAGWYTDSSEPAYLRFWNGTAWSAHRKPRPGLPAAYLEARSRAEYQRSGRIR